MAVEMAICLPIAVLAVLTLMYFIRVSSIQESVNHILSDEMRRVIAEPEQSAFLYTSAKNRVDTELKGDIDEDEYDIYITPDFIGGGEYGNIAASISWSKQTPWGRYFGKAYQSTENVIARLWIGKSNQSSAMPWADMENDGNDHTVWVFPESGAKYHNVSCTHVKNSAREAILTKTVKSKYSNCKTCKSSSLPEGSIIYIHDYGDRYHASTCSTVTKYVVSMSESDAKSRHYTACAKCGG
jgi:hypothetical protein